MAQGSLGALLYRLAFRTPCASAPPTLPAPYRSAFPLSLTGPPACCRRPVGALLPDAGHLRAFEPQGLALLVWALATLGHRHEPLLQAIDAYYCSHRDRWAREGG